MAVCNFFYAFEIEGSKEDYMKAEKVKLRLDYRVVDRISALLKEVTSEKTFQSSVNLDALKQWPA